MELWCCIPAVPQSEIIVGVASPPHIFHVHYDKGRMHHWGVCNPVSEIVALHYWFGSYVPSTPQMLWISHNNSPSVPQQGERGSAIPLFPRNDEGSDLTWITVGHGIATVEPKWESRTGIQSHTNFWTVGRGSSLEGEGIENCSCSVGIQPGGGRGGLDETV